MMTDSSNFGSVSSNVVRQPHTSSSATVAGSAQTDNHFVIAKCRRNTDVPSNQNATNNQESTEDSDIEEKILVVYCRAGKLGAAYYTLQTGELHILDEIVDRPPEFLMFLNLFRQVAPSRVLLDGKTQGAFVQAVKKTVFDCDGSGEGSCKLMFISAREYSFEACKRRILTLSLPHEPPNCSEDERTLFLRTVVDFNQTQSVHALGALLRYLDLNWSSLCMDLHSKPQFLRLKKISLADIVTMDEDTYRGLQIFSSVSHPSGFKRGVHGSNKEGLSLFYVLSKCSSKTGQSRMRADIVTMDEDTYRGLQIFSSVSHPSGFKRGVHGSNKEGLSLFYVLGKCSSKTGQSRMRLLMQHPTTNLETLRRRQDVIAFFLRPQSDVIMKNMCSSLRFIKNVNGILAKIKALSAKAYQWKSLYNTLYNAVLICEMCEGAARSSEFLQELASCDNNKLYEMALYMNRIIDFDLTKSEGKFTVKAGVDPDLDMKKQTMASLHGLMSETAKVELERLPGFVQECTMLYMPHLGYLLGVKAWADDLTMEQKELPNMRFMNNDYIHYKSKGCEELDMMIGDTYPEIVAHETRIMMRLTTIILENLHTLAAVIDKCSELDCLIAISKVCKEFGFVRPTLTTDKVLSITQGRHPLHAAASDCFVPNDAESSREAGLVKILTGPNSSGKSVYMKQIGLIVYLAHIGSFVPAERATIGVVAHIYSRIQSTECVAAHMSAFLIDLRQMALALQESTSNSLIIIDEFGKGTSEVDGLALLAACLNTFLFREDNCPHLLLSTHFLNIQKYIVNTPIVRFQRFEHTLQDGEPVFLFRLIEGSAVCSFAHDVAQASGIDAGVVRRARQLLDCITNNKLPPENKKITAKLKSFTEIIKNDLLAEDI